MTDTEHTLTDETPERAFLTRSYAASMSAGDGRTVDVRIVPYGERIQHNDGHGGLPRGVPYTEEWVPGAFSSQVKATGREPDPRQLRASGGPRRCRRPRARVARRPRRLLRVVPFA